MSSGGAGGGPPEGTSGAGRRIGRWRVRDVLAVVAGCVAVARLWSVLSVHEVWGAMPDSAGYRDPAGGAAPIGLGGGGIRPWTVPAVYALAGTDGIRAGVQVVASLAAWTTLAAVVAREVRRPWLAVASGTAVLVVSCSWNVVSWDLAILAESLALSTGVALVAAWIAHLRHPTAWSAAAVVGASVLWGFTRVQNAPFVALGAVVAVALAVGRRGDPAPRRLRWLTAGALVVVAAWALAAVGPGDRGYAAREPARVTLFAETFALNLRFTVLPDPAATAWFLDQGMPRPVALEPLVRESPHEDAWDTWPAYFEAYQADHQLVDWVERDGRSTFTRWVLTHPGPIGSRFASDLGHVLVPPASSLGYAFPRPILPDPVAAVVAPQAGPGRTSPVAPLLAVAAVATAVRRRWPPNRRLAAVGATVVVASVAGLFLAWLGSPVEHARHAVPFSVLVVLGALLVAVASLDRAPEPGAATPAGGDPPRSGGRGLRLGGRHP